MQDKKQFRSICVEDNVMKNFKLTTRITAITLLILVIGLGTVWGLAEYETTSAMKQSVISKLDDSVESRYEIVNSFVEMAEAYLVGYSQAPELTEFFLDMESEEKLNKLQAYTESYAKVNENLENIYAASVESVVKASVVKPVIGVQLRTGDALTALQAEVFDDDTVWNTGIMASKSTGAMVVSMYYPLYYNGQPIGYTGGAIYAEDLRNTLLGLANEDCSYMLLDVPNNAYIFHQDDALIGAVIEDEEVLNIINSAMQNSESTGTYDDAVNETLAVTKYDAERGWVFVAVTDYDNAFAAVNKTAALLAITCLAVLLVCAVLVWIFVKKPSKDFARLGNIIEEIGTLDLTNAERLEKYSKRKDEVGIIAKASGKLVSSVKEVIENLIEQSKQLEDTSRQMLENAASVNDSLKGVELAIEEIADGAGEQASETQKASNSVVSMGTMIETAAEKVGELSSVNNYIRETGESALDTLRLLTKINDEAKLAIDEINQQTRSTNESAQSIRGAAEFITSIAEETNLLSLNASIEAARAGEQGRGFAVVASQIQKLAEQSNKSAQQIEQIIGHLIADSTKAVETMDAVKKIMDEKSKHLQTTEQQFAVLNDGIEKSLEGVERIVKEIKAIDGDRVNVVDVVQNLTAIAEENAAGTEETLASTGLVTDMMEQMEQIANRLNGISTGIEQSISDFKI